MKSYCLDIPIHRHQLFHIFAYLKKHHNTEMVFDLYVTDFNAEKLHRQDWSQTVYVDASPDRPPNITKPQSQGFIVIAHVHSEHAGDTVTRRPRTGFFIYCNNALVYWIYKKQGSIESSSFGSEFVTMKAWTEYIWGLKFKIQMMSIQCDLSAFIYGDNQSILANKTMPYSIL